MHARCATGTARSCCARSSPPWPPDREPVEYLKARGDDLQATLDKAAARGERVPTVDEVLDFVLAPLYLRVLFRRPVEPGTGARLVERVLTALPADPAPNAGRGG
ncbi:TetR-like C-terminal domain-containing protein [Amycolatopsis sp. NPDC101161]|uniref:TetR-like C-terminal domain-containing protein n=1 Tax=Amycolatopsis sp. NPDC101161 TaxID=3363940 RepID=UPI00380E6E07